MRKSIGCALWACVLLGLAWTWGGGSRVYAQEPAAVDALIQKLEDLQSTIHRQQAEIEDLKSALKELQHSQERVEEAQKAEIQKVVLEEVGKKTKGLEWTERLRLSGDIRLRYEGLYKREQNGVDEQDRHRFRVRLRGYADANITDEVSMYAMLTTSDSQEGRTSNQSLKDEFDNKPIYIGRAYATYRPKWLPGGEVGFGKFKNPFLHSDISWDPDVNQEGFYELYQYKGWDCMQPFIRFGQMLVSENNFSKDAALFLWQGGVQWNLWDTRFTLAGSYYDYINLERTRLGEGSRPSGNTTVLDPDLNRQVLAYDFKIAELIASVDFDLLGYPIRLWSDYLRNTASRVPSDQTTAWGAGFDIGKARAPGEWKLEYRYKEIEADAVLGYFADGDFFGTNREGHKVRFTYRLTKPISLSASFFETDSIQGDNHENRLQLDTILTF